MSFNSYHHVSRVPGERKLYVMEVPIPWELGRKGSGHVETIPMGFKADVSVPRLLEWAVDPHDIDILVPAALHDHLLVDGYDDAFASSEFRRALIARGMGKPKAWLLFLTTLVWTAATRKRRLRSQ